MKMFHFFHLLFRLLLFQFSHDRQMQNASQELSQKYILPRTTQRRRRRRRVRRCRWQRYKRIATKLCICIEWWRRRRIQYNHLTQFGSPLNPGPSATHTHQRRARVFLNTKFHSVNESSRLMHMHMNDRRALTLLSQTEPTNARSSAHVNKLYADLYHHAAYTIYTYSVQFNDDESDDQVKSATLIQNNNMDYENIARRWQTVTLENDRLCCVPFANDSQSQLSHWLSLMNENGNLTKLCSSGCGCRNTITAYGHTLTCGKFQMPRRKKKKHNSHCIPHHTYWISDEIIHLESVPIYDKTHVLISYCLSSSWSYVLVRPKRTWNQTLQVDVPKSEKTHVISMMIIFGDIYVECRMWRYSSTFWGKAHSYSHIRRHTIVIRYVNAVLRFSVLKRTAVCQKSETKYLCEKNGN